MDTLEDAPQKVNVTIDVAGGGFVAGVPNDVAITFRIAPGWHIYWPGLNDTGPGPSIELTLPEGWSAGPIRWPAPHRRYTQPGEILDHIYERSVTALVAITPDVPTSPASEPSGREPEGQPSGITFAFDWLVCEEVCLGESAQIMLQPMLRDAGSPLATWTPAQQAALDAARAAIPTLIDHTKPASPIRLAWSGTSLNIAVPGAAALAFYPFDDGIWPVSTLEDGAARANRLSVRFPSAETDAARRGPAAGSDRTSPTPPRFVHALVHATFPGKAEPLIVEVRVARDGSYVPNPRSSQSSARTTAAAEQGEPHPPGG